MIVLQLLAFVWGVSFHIVNHLTALLMWGW